MFEKKVIIVTGGLKGIGRGISEYFANQNAKVFALGRSKPNDYVELFSKDSFSKNVTFIEADISNSESVTNAVKNIINDTGKVDVLINNAGITKDNLMLRMSELDWDTVMNTNLKGSFLMVKAVVKQMISQRYGKIINIGSIVGSIGNPGQVNYSASKSGLVGFTKSLAKELASRNILVNLIAPGYVNTEMTEKLTEEQKSYFLNNIPLKRMADPKDIASVAAFFASDASNYITGQVIHVDGGLAM